MPRFSCCRPLWPIILRQSSSNYKLLNPGRHTQSADGAIRPLKRPSSVGCLEHFHFHNRYLPPTLVSFHTSIPAQLPTIPLSCRQAVSINCSFGNSASNGTSPAYTASTNAANPPGSLILHLMVSTTLLPAALTTSGTGAAASVSDLVSNADAALSASNVFSLAASASRCACALAVAVLACWTR